MMPFPGGLEATANATLVFSAAAAFIAFVMLDRPASWRKTVAAPLALLLLAVLAFTEQAPWPLAAGLVLSGLAHALLAQDDPRALGPGLAALSASHLAYLQLFAVSGGGLAGLMGDPLRAAAGALVLVLASTVLLRHRAVPDAAARAAAVACLAAAAAMGLAALTLAVPSVAAAALVLAASTALLAEAHLRRGGLGSRQAAWILHYAAQAAVTLGVLGVL